MSYQQLIAQLGPPVLSAAVTLFCLLAVLFIVVYLHDKKQALERLEAQAYTDVPLPWRRWRCWHCEGSWLEYPKSPDGLCDACHQPPAAPVPEELSA